jgi:hypothetical protein
MSFTKSPLRRARNGRVALARFVEVEMPQLNSEPVIVEMEGGGRILLNDPSHVALVAQLLEHIASLRKGGRPC